MAGTACTIAMLKGEPAGPQWLAELGLRYLCAGSDGRLGGTVLS